MQKIKIIAELRDFGTKEYPVIKGATDDNYHFVYIFKSNDKYIGAHPSKKDTYGAILIFSSSPQIPKEEEIDEILHGLGLAISYGAIDLPIPNNDKMEIKMLVDLNDEESEFKIIEILKKNIELKIESSI